MVLPACRPRCRHGLRKTSKHDWSTSTPGTKAEEQPEQDEPVTPEDPIIVRKRVAARAKASEIAHIERMRRGRELCLARARVQQVRDAEEHESTEAAEAANTQTR